MARTQSPRYPEIRRGMLRKAARLFARKGYAQTTIDDLSRACGASRGNLYHYFDSKKAMLREILDDHLEEMTAAVGEAAASADDAQARYQAVARAMVRVNARSQSEQIVLLNDLQYLDRKHRDAIVARQNALVSTVSDLLGAIDDRHRLNGTNRKVYTMMFLGMINYTYLWYDPRGAVSPDEYADMVTNIFLDGFAGQGA